MRFRAIHDWCLRAALASVIGGAAVSSHAINVGESGPQAVLPSRSGAAVTLPDKEAKLTYVDFWASWCGPCRQSFPWLNRMQARYGSKGLHIVAVNLDATRVDAEKFLADIPPQFDVVFDSRGATAKAYSLKAMPSSVLIGADGKVIATHMGFRTGDPEELESIIKSELAKKS